MSEKLSYNQNAANSNDWENISSDQIDDVDKAHEMANIEDQWRNHINNEVSAASEAAIREEYDTQQRHNSNVEYASKMGPEAVEQTARNYDIAKEKARAEALAEQNRYRPEWRNVSSERIENSDKARAMAEVEDQWRTNIDDRVAEIRVAVDNNISHPLVGIAANEAYTENRYNAEVYGPKAVEEVAKAYDTLRGTPEKSE